MVSEVKYKRPKAVDAFGPFEKVGLDTGPSDRVQQHFKDECDIGSIMKRFNATGLVTHVNTYKPQYGDFTSVGDYHSAMNAVIEANEYFHSLPASFRERFGQDPKVFFEYLQDPANLKELQDLGILSKSEAPSTTSSDAASAPHNAGEAASEEKV